MTTGIGPFLKMIPIELVDLPALHKTIGCEVPTTHPHSGKPFTHLGWEASSNDELVRTYPPLPPDRIVEVCGDHDGEEVTRYLTDEEYAQAMAEWEAAYKRWEKTHGMLYVPGSMTVHLHGLCEDGDFIEYVGNGHGALRESRYRATR